MTPPVYVLGGAQTDFALNWTRQGWDLDDMLRSVMEAGFEACAVDPEEVQSAHVGNFVGTLFRGQGMLGGLLAEVCPAFRELPISRHEAACASGSMALTAAMTEIEAGRYDLVCVPGIEMMRNVHGDRAAEFLGAAAWNGREAEDARYVWPHVFSELTQEYDRRYGLDYRYLGAIAENNYRNAAKNPHAQTRDWTFRPENFIEDDEHNPVVEGRVRRFDCGRVTDGAAVLFLASQRFADAWSRRHDRAPLARIEGWGHRTARLPYADKVADSREEPLILSHVARTIQDAFNRAGVTLDDIDAIETHDCFAVTEYMAVDHFGITAPGESWKAVEEGVIAMGGRLPINPSGGLIGLGHPVGATGIRMVLDAWKQVTGNAGACQVEGACRVATLNIGGSTTTTACFVIGKAL
ncbi:MAG: acetyl-CoA acetyltransferase [Acidobacteriota bacterium]|nr:acetyl-CoA acetyltransferase [Acidobacteriota bacterium]